MENEKSRCRDSAQIERGRITQAGGGLYKVSSYGRSGLTTPGLPPMDPQASYQVNDKVYFFMFDDGHGMILGKI